MLRMRNIKKLIMGTSLLLSLGALTSCSSGYKLNYEYKNELEGYIVYSNNPLSVRIENQETIDFSSSFAKEIAAYTFYRCENTQEFGLPISLRYIDAYAFAECKSLQSINFPADLEKIDSCAFRCSGLTSITLPSKVNYVGTGAFAGCPLETITISLENQYFDTRENINAIIYTKTNELVAGCKNTVIPDSVKSIAKYAFFGIEGITSLSIPEGVEIIKDYAFYDSSIESIDLPKSVNDIKSSALVGIKSVNYPGTMEEFEKIYSCDINHQNEITVNASDGKYTYSVLGSSKQD